MGAAAGTIEASIIKPGMGIMPGGVDGPVCEVLDEGWTSYGTGRWLEVDFKGEVVRIRVDPKARIMVLGIPAGEHRRGAI